MRSLIRSGAVLAILTLAASASGQDSEKEWKAAAKKVIDTTTAKLKAKAGKDEAALTGLKDLKASLLTDEELNRVVKDMKKELKTDSPNKDQIDKLVVKITKHIDKADADQIKKALAEKDPKSPYLPCPPFKGCPDCSP